MWYLNKYLWRYILQNIPFIKYLINHIYINTSFLNINNNLTPQNKSKLPNIYYINFYIPKFLIMQSDLNGFVCGWPMRLILHAGLPLALYNLEMSTNFQVFFYYFKTCSAIPETKENPVVITCNKASKYCPKNPKNRLLIKIYILWSTKNRPKERPAP